MPSSRKIIQFYKSGEVKTSDDNSTFWRQMLSYGEKKYIFKSTYSDTRGKNKLEDSIIWDPNRISLEEIANLEISGLNKEVARKLRSYLRENKFNIIDISNQKLMSIKINSFNGEWSTNEILRSDIKNQRWMSDSAYPWYLDQKKSSYRSPHSYVKYTLYWDPNKTNLDKVTRHFNSIVDKWRPSSDEKVFINSLIRANRQMKIDRII
jgi:hypothetical protein